MQRRGIPFELRAPVLLGGITLMLQQAAWGQAAATDPAQAAAQPAVEEIVVTATRRAERLKDVPIAVSAISGDEVEAKRLSNFSDVVNITPGPTFVPVKGSATSALQIRGQFSQNDATGLETPVGVYIDDIYYGSLASYDSDFFDMKQIAILRGPQGTTFGRNAVGGALQVTSNVARIGDKSAQLSLTGLKYKGGQGGLESSGYINVPIRDDLAGRLAFSLKDVGGYQHNLVTGHYLADNKIGSIKGSMTYQPSGDFKVSALLSYSDRNNRGDGPRLYGMGALAAQEAAASSSFHDVMVDDEGKVKRKIASGVLRIEQNTGLGTFASITGFRRLDATFAEDSDGGPLPLNYPSVNANKETQVSQEFRLTSESGRQLEYVAGVYMSYEQLSHSVLFNFNGTYPQSILSSYTGGTLQTQTISSDIKNISVGPYAEGKWHFNQQWALTAGLRYVFENKSGRTDHIGSSPFYGAAYSQALPGPLDSRHIWRAWTPRFILDYKPSKEHMLYASLAKGFQGGGWVMTPTSAAKAQIPLDPETTWSYEAGAKSSWFGGLVNTNLALYQATTKNLQVRSLVNGVLTDSNAGTEEVKGAELEAILRPTPNLGLGVNYAYTDAKYKEFAGCAAGNVSCTGNQVPFTPKNDTTVFADYRWRLASGDALQFHLDDKFASAYQLVATNAQQIAVPLTKRNGILNGSITYTPAHGDWNLRFWGRNLTDRTVVSNGLNYYFYNMSAAEVAAAGGSSKADSERLVIGAPRTLGVTLTMNY